MGDAKRDGRATLREVFAAARDQRLSAEELRLWLLYRWLERPEHGGFMGDAKLAEHLGRSPRSVQGYRASLLERGYLDQELRGPKPARYRAVLPEGAETPPEDAEPAGQGGEGGPSGDDAAAGVRTPWPTASELPKDESGQYVYPDAFERCWALYPNREGGNPKRGAYGAWRARVTDGAEPEELEEATRRYARFVRKTDTEPRYVKMAQTFYGPKGFWEEDWSVNGDAGGDPSDPISSRSDALSPYGGDDG